MKHTCKEFWDMLEKATELGCRVIPTKSGAIKVIPPNKVLPMYTCHESDKGIHPLRRYLKNTCNFSIV